MLLGDGARYVAPPHYEALGLLDTLLQVSNEFENWIHSQLQIFFCVLTRCSDSWSYKGMYACVHVGHPLHGSSCRFVHILRTDSLLHVSHVLAV